MYTCPMRAPSFPAELLADHNRVLRPQDATDYYVNPWAEFSRMTRTGVLQRIGHGYYLAVPDHLRGRAWRPEIEGVTLGIGVADYGRSHVSLMGISAARLHRAVPRALAVGTIAVDGRRTPKELTIGRVVFVTRNVDRLDLQVVETEVVSGMMTTPEQTAVDLADRPTLSGVGPASVSEAITNLVGRIDWDHTVDLALKQRKRSAVTRLRWLAAAVGLSLSAPVPKQPVPSLGLRPATAVDPLPYGIEPWSTPAR